MTYAVVTIQCDPQFLKTEPERVRTLSMVTQLESGGAGQTQLVQLQSPLLISIQGEKEGG